MNARPLPGHIRQIGYVVKDLDSALQAWVALGVGPWFVLRQLPQRADYRGRPCEVSCSIALANSGDLQIELIQQHDDTASIFTEFLSAHGEGFHQLAYWPEDFEAALATTQDAGWPVVWSGADASGIRYAYVEPPAGSASVVELMELNDVTRGLADFVRQAADGWDGTEPVRALN
jgi:hypothetical protein